MKKVFINIVLIGLLSLFNFTAKSQSLVRVANRVSLTGGVGLSWYNGDLNGDLWNLNPKIMHFAWRLGLDYDLSKKWRIGYTFLNGNLSGSDQYFKNNNWRYNIRKQDFKTKLKSHDLLLKYHLFDINKLEAHLAFGVSSFSFSPTVLDPSFNTTFTPASENRSFAVNLGTELIYAIDKNWSISVLGLYHKTFTDSIDATDINKNSKDRYISLIVSARYHFYLGRGEGAVKKKKKAKCPAYN